MNPPDGKLRAFRKVVIRLPAAPRRCPSFPVGGDRLSPSSNEPELLWTDSANRTCASRSRLWRRELRHYWNTPRYRTRACRVAFSIGLGKEILLIFVNVKMGRSVRAKIDFLAARPKSHVGVPGDRGPSGAPLKVGAIGYLRPRASIARSITKSSKTEISRINIHRVFARS
jgi:hypothetical protein